MPNIVVEKPEVTKPQEKEILDQYKGTKQRLASACKQRVKKNK